MKIYTKTGDSGETGLFAGPRVRKDDPRVEAYGTVDELSSAIGVAESHMLDGDSKQLLCSIQSDLFSIGSELATPTRDKLSMAPISVDRVVALEVAIDKMEESLPPLKTFILPGGSSAAAHVHLARAVCRRAERLIVGLARDAQISDQILPYFNRLSDCLFVMARFQNQLAGTADVEWRA
ncbi:MAG: cob(I)yrinic acid a,c-diamide adenosyltransferase [Planctomycetales bacterium]|nr:cob(I)yrinic acid a,c-diamide adenosyltransferase [Planctomycetales bacterium]